MMVIQLQKVNPIYLFLSMFILGSFQSNPPPEPDTCNCTIKTPVILDDSESLKNFAGLIESQCPKSEANICIDNTLTMSTINISDEMFDQFLENSNVISISGSLVLNRTLLTEIPRFLRGLQRIGDINLSSPSNIEVKNNTALRSFLLPNYRGKIQGKVEFYSNPKLETIKLFKTISSVSALKLISNLSIRKLEPIHISTANSIHVLQNPLLESIAFTSNMLTIRKELRIENNFSERLTSIDLSKLRAPIDGSIENISITNNRYLKTLIGPNEGSNLTHLENLIIQGNQEDLSEKSPRLNSISGFSSLKEVTNQLLLSSINASSSELASSIGKNLHAVQDLYMLNNDRLKDLIWMSSLKEITGGLYLKFNDNLCDCNIKMLCDYDFLSSDAVANNGLNCSSVEVIKSVCAGVKTIDLDLCNERNTETESNRNTDGG